MNAIKRIASRTFLRKAADQPWVFPLVLLPVGGVAYGLMIPNLGFYWDDWESVFLKSLNNPSLSFSFNYYAERPFSALSYLAFFQFLKETPLAWQVLALLLRWGGILLLNYTLNAVWLERQTMHRWIGLLLFVFPGYLEQSVSAAFNPHLTALFLFSASLWMTLMAIKQRKLFWLWMPLSVVAGITQIFMMEYFVCLEVLRPVLIWCMLQGQPVAAKRRSLGKTMLYWLPFLVGIGVYAWWRFIELPLSMPANPNAPLLLDQILRAPISGLSDLVRSVYYDLVYLLGSAWANTFSADALNLLAKTTWIAWGLGCVAAILFSLYLARTAKNDSPAEKKTFGRVFALGFLAILAGAAPIWAKESQISDGKWSDRFALAAMFGAVVVIVTGIDWLIKTQNQKRFILTLLLAASIAVQIDNGNKFRLDWDQQRALYWQLSWRIPALKPGTAVIGNGTFTDKSSYYDGIYILNLLFDPQPAANPRYTYLDIGHFAPYNYQPGVPILTTVRSGQFTGSTSAALGIYFKSSATCARVLDSLYSDDPFFKQEVNQLIDISNTAQILTDAAPTTPDPAIFGTEPAHTWCYYFEKADLARQLQDWQTVLQLGQQANAKGFAPGMGAEYLPFIEAYAQTGQWAQAYDLSLSAQQVNPAFNLKPILCNNWTRFATLTSGLEKDAYLAKANAEFCGVG